MAGFEQRLGDELAAAAKRQVRRRRWRSARLVRPRARVLVLVAFVLVGAGGTAGLVVTRGRVGGPPTLRFARITPAQRAAGIRPLTRPVIFATGHTTGIARRWQLIGFQTTRGFCVELDWPLQRAAAGCGANVPANGRVIDWQGQVALAGGRNGIVVGAVVARAARVRVRYVHSVHRPALIATARVVRVVDPKLLAAMGLHAPFAYYLAQLRGPFFAMRADALDAHGNVIGRAGIPDDMSDARGGNFVLASHDCGRARSSLPPILARTAPPASALRLLGVLRRPRRPSDRLPEPFDRALASWPMTAVVEVDAIRRLGRAADGSALYLILTIGRPEAGLPRDCLRTLTPAERASEQRALARARAAESGFHLGLFTLRARGAGGTTEYRLPTTPPRAGANVAGHLVFGLVPDGVATVQVRFADGTRRNAVVHANAWSVTVPTNAGRTRILRQTWRDAHGRDVQAVR